MITARREGSYRLEAHETLPQGVRRMTCAEIDLALAHLTGASATSSSPAPDRDEAIHEVRKCFKKIRAILRLVRDDIGKDHYRRENINYRDAGRRLADLRESAVMVETLDKLTASFATEPGTDAFAHVRAALAMAHESFSRQVHDEENVMAATAEFLCTARLRVPDWPVTGDDFTAAATGLRRVYRRGRRRLADAYATSPSSSPRPEVFHEWRKEVKYLWYHVTILELLRPDVLQLYAGELHDLSDYLGDDHDLYLLRRTLAERPEIVGSAQKFPPALLTLVERRRTDIQAAARPLGQRLYAEEPDAFVRRLSDYWDDWKRET